MSFQLKCDVSCKLYNLLVRLFVRLNHLEKKYPSTYQIICPTSDKLPGYYHMDSHNQLYQYK